MIAARPIQDLTRGLGRNAFDLPVAALAGLAAAVIAFAMPADLLGRLVSATGLPHLLAAAEPPLGLKARAGIGIVGAAAAFGLVYMLMRLLDGAGRRERAEPEPEPSDEDRPQASPPRSPSGRAGLPPHLRHPRFWRARTAAAAGREPAEPAAFGPPGRKAAVRRARARAPPGRSADRARQRSQARCPVLAAHCRPGRVRANRGGGAGAGRSAGAELARSGRNGVTESGLEPEPGSTRAGTGAGAAEPVRPRRRNLLAELMRRLEQGLARRRSRRVFGPAQAHAPAPQVRPEANDDRLQNAIESLQRFAARGE